MKLVGLVDGPEHVCCRYRLAAFRPFFEQAGHTLELWPLPRAWWRRLFLFRQLRQFDVVILQRKLLQTWQLAMLRTHVQHLVFDFDDAVFQRDSYAGRPLANGKRWRRFQALMQGVDKAVAGNRFLGDKAQAAVSWKPVHVIPTCIDLARYPLAKHETRSGSASLVWIGSSSTLPSLELIRPWLEETGKQTPGLSLKLIADREAYFTPLRTYPCRWKEATEASELAKADIGISWLPDDDWSRGKCGLKVLQYMAAGLPVVANPVGVHVDMIQHGVNGYLVQSKTDWLDAMSRLAADPQLRMRLGQAGRLLVEVSYSVQTGAGRWLKLLGQLQGGRMAA